MIFQLFSRPIALRIITLTYDGKNSLQEIIEASKDLVQKLCKTFKPDEEHPDVRLSNYNHQLKKLLVILQNSKEIESFENKHLKKIAEKMDSRSHRDRRSLLGALVLKEIFSIVPDTLKRLQLILEDESSSDVHIKANLIKFVLDNADHPQSLDTFVKYLHEFRPEGYTPINQPDYCPNQHETQQAEFFLRRENQFGMELYAIIGYFGFQLKKIDGFYSAIDFGDIFLDRAELQQMLSSSKVLEINKNYLNIFLE